MKKFSFYNFLSIVLLIFCGQTSLVQANNCPLNMVITVDEGSPEEVSRSNQGEAGAVTWTLSDAILQDIPVVTTIAPLALLIKKVEIPTATYMDKEQQKANNRARMDATRALMGENKWAVYLNEEDDIAVLVPCTNPITNIEQLGFDGNHLRKVNSNLLASTIGKLEYKRFNIDHFKQLFSEGNNTSKRIYLIGHGEEATKIGGMIEDEYKQFLVALNELNTEFLSIDSCYAGGRNLLLMHNLLSCQNRDAFSLSQVNYPIVIIATADLPTKKPTKDGYLKQFFLKLDDFLRENVFYFGIPKKRDSEPISIRKVLLPLYEGIDDANRTLSYPSIRFPGTNTFFRAMNVDDLSVITYVGLKRYILEKKLAEIKEKRKRGEEIPQSKSVLPIITVDEKAKNILVYPSIIKGVVVNITEDCTKQSGPLFISKIPGQAVHFIDHMVTPKHSLLTLAKFFLPKYSHPTTKAWFIKKLECSDGIITGLVILKPGIPKFNTFSSLPSIIIFSGDYSIFGEYYSKDKKSFVNANDINEKLYYNFFTSELMCNNNTLFIDTNDSRKIQLNCFLSKDKYQKIVNFCYDMSKPDPSALQEASGGNENMETVDEAFEDFLSSVGIKRDGESSSFDFKLDMVNYFYETLEIMGGCKEGNLDTTKKLFAELIVNKIPYEELVKKDYAYRIISGRGRSIDSNLAVYWVGYWIKKGKWDYAVDLINYLIGVWGYPFITQELFKILHEQQIPHDRLKSIAYNASRQSFEPLKEQIKNWYAQWMEKGEFCPTDFIVGYLSIISRNEVGKEIDLFLFNKLINSSVKVNEVFRVASIMLTNYFEEIRQAAQDWLTDIIHKVSKSEANSMIAELKNSEFSEYKRVVGQLLEESLEKEISLHRK